MSGDIGVDAGAPAHHVREQESVMVGEMPVDRSAPLILLLYLDKRGGPRRKPSVAREVPGATEVIAECCTAHDYDDPGKPAITWDDRDARDRLVDALVGDAHRLLGHLPDAELGPRAAEAVALLP